MWETDYFKIWEEGGGSDDKQDSGGVEVAALCTSS